MDVREFKGEWRFLSNFHPIGVNGQTIEHFYQAGKTLDKAQQERVLAAPSALVAKKLGRSVTLRKDWGTIRVSLMLDLIRVKFEDKELADKLLTIDGDIVEGNYWHDVFWGVCNGKCFRGPHDPTGLNWLGRILMQVRNEIKERRSV